MKLIILTIITFFCVQVSFAQSSKLEKGDKYFERYSFDKAIRSYEDQSSFDIDMLRKLALSYQNRAEFVNAEITYQKYIHRQDCSANDYYNYVLCLKAQKKYDTARTWMEVMRYKFPTDLRVISYVHTIPIWEALCIPNEQFVISNLKFNSSEDDFCTAFRLSSIVFTSTRNGKAPAQQKYNWNRKPFLDIYTASLDSEREFLDVKYWNKKWNKKWHEGPACFTQKGLYTAYTRNNYDEESVDDVVRLQIFFSTFNNDQWDEPIPFYLNSPNYSVGHPFLFENGKRMIFVSDMPNGYGGSDLYIIEKDISGNWGVPTNFGAVINTEANEMFPFFCEKTQCLYFASNGLFGLGGLDVYVSKLTDNGFQAPINLGSPINSNSDDFAYIVDSTSSYGFFSSDREEGKGGDDIYKFTYIFNEKADTYIYRLFVENEETKLPIKGARVQIGSRQTSSDTLGIVTHQFLDSFTCVTNVSAWGYKDVHKKLVITLPKNDSIVNDTVRMQIDENNILILKEIYYDFDKWDILPESALELNKVVSFLKENPTRTIQLSSHTDSRGSDSYNLRLSQARANSAINYILSKGIDASRIKGVGYGESRPVNNCINTVPCSESEHRANRRTEIYISGYGNAQKVFQIKGKF